MKNTSINIPTHIDDWLSKEAVVRSLNKSQVVTKLIQERIDGKTRTSGFLTDIDWLLDQELAVTANNIKDMELAWRQQTSTPEGFDAMYSIYFVNTHVPVNSAKRKDAILNIMVAESSRTNLRDLFASAVMQSLSDKGVGTMMVIPYKLNPKHEVWEALAKFDEIKVVTPDSFGRVMRAIISIQYKQRRLTEKVQLSRDTENKI